MVATELEIEDPHAFIELERANKIFAVSHRAKILKAAEVRIKAEKAHATEECKAGPKVTPTPECMWDLARTLAKDLRIRFQQAALWDLPNRYNRSCTTQGREAMAK